MRHEELTMDEICQTREGFHLQKHQQFLKEWTAENEWQYLLLFHQIGSGKTCSAITIAEASRKHVVVVMPAGLKTNFTDELMTECAENRYISPEDAKRYREGRGKDRILAQFERNYKEKYTLYSIDKFRIEALANRGRIREWIVEMTADRLFIFDEVQHLVNTAYDEEWIEKVMATGVFPEKPVKIDGINSVVMRLLTYFAHPSAQFLMLSATPVFDNLEQFRQLVQIMNPRDRIVEMQTVGEMVPFVRNKISYFPKINEHAYPKVVVQRHKVPISVCQDRAMDDAQAAKPGDEISEAFLSLQRQISLDCPEEYRTTELSLSTDEGLLAYAPKILECIKRLDRIGKHMVYFNFIEKGVDVLIRALRARGWTEYDPDHPREDGQCYVKWIGDMNDKERRVVKEVLNHVSNIDGRVIRLIIGSPAMKEGISFKHIQNVHMLDMLWNTSAIDQIEGRAIRYCSHADIPLDHPALHRRVKINRYVLVARAGGRVRKTVDELIQELIEKKDEGSSAAIKLLKKVAIDHYLFRELEQLEHSPMPDRPYSPGHSPVEHENRPFRSVARDDQKNPCAPHKRRRGTCKAGFTPFDKLDEKGRTVGCCRKTKKSEAESSGSIIDLTAGPPRRRRSPDVEIISASDYAELRRLKAPKKV